MLARRWGRTTDWSNRTQVEPAARGALLSPERAGSNTGAVKEHDDFVMADRVGLKQTLKINALNSLTSVIASLIHNSF